MTMILFTTAVTVATVVLLMIRFWRLTRECDRLRCIAQAWQDYACAVEVALECQGEFDYADHHRDIEYHVTREECRNAERAARLALERLQELGEYPDAWQCCAFLPYEEDDDE